MSNRVQRKGLRDPDPKREASKESRHEAPPVSADVNPAPNRRVHVRGAVIVREARCISGMQVFFGYGTNVSRGGIFIAASAPRKRSTDDVFEIRFSLPGIDHPFHCRARVVWVRTYRSGAHQTPGFGVQFLDLPDRDAELIEAWVDQRTAEGSGT